VAEKPSVAILMPTGEVVDPKVMRSLLSVGLTAQANGHKVPIFGMAERMVVHQARNMLAETFLKTGIEWCFWMDSDMILEPRTIPVMMKWAEVLKAKMLTGIYYQRLGNHKPVLWRRKCVSAENGEILYESKDRYAQHFVHPGGVGGTPFQVDAAGFGCVLLHRSVIEAMQKPYFKFVDYENDKGQPVMASEDFYFFANAKDFGFDLWAVPELRCIHLGDRKQVQFEDMKIDDKMDVKAIDVGERPEKEAIHG
jgi:hypothetical protein